MNEVVEATGHSVVYVPAKAADCTHDGYEAYAYCSVCGEEIIPKVAIAALGHDYGEWETDIAATCEEEGSETHSCKICGTVEKRVVPATGHSVVDVSAKAADCTQDGYGAYAYCSECGEEIIPKVTVAALGHDFGEWETDIAATCVAEGVEKRVCIRCGISETRAIPVTEHEWEEVFVLPATEMSEGKTTYECSICHAVKEETVPKIEHVHDYDYVSIYGVGVACSCGRVKANEGNVMMNADGFVYGINEGSGNVIVVPNSAYDVDWETVFYMNDEIEYIYFGENITAIDNSFAFEGCDNLKAIYVSSECSIPVVPDFWPDMEIIRVDYNS